MSSGTQLTEAPIHPPDLLAIPVQSDVAFKSVFDMKPSTWVGRASSF